MDKLDKEFYEKADILVGFTDNAYKYFLKGNFKRKKKILGWKDCLVHSRLMATTCFTSCAVHIM